MKLLLDTHIWLWMLSEPEKLTKRVAEALQGTSNELWLSPITIWEVVLLERKGRIRPNRSLDEWISEALRSSSAKEAPLTNEVALATKGIRTSHRDPADLFLLATAKVYELTLVTADARLIGVRGISVLANQ